MTETQFRVELDEKDARVDARFFGDLTIDAEEALNAAFRAARLEGRPALVVDFAHVPYVNSAGIAALLGTLIHLRERTSSIRFVGLNRHLEKIFRMTGFPSLVSM